MYFVVALTVLHSAFINGNSFLHECAKYCKPKNYFDLLPQLNMPYIDRLPIPNNHIIKNRDYLTKLQKIQPSPVVTTKVISIKTKYVYKNPVCVKYNKKQKFCTLENVKNRENVEKLVTKDFFVKNSENVEKKVSTVDSEENDMESDQFNLKVSFSNLESSEQSDELQASRSFKNPKEVSRIQTPSLPYNSINEMLIEDRLDQLETIIPDYTRRRVFQTRTLYVTKTISNRRSMATLLVKNCVPLGYEICARKIGNGNKSKKRKGRRSSKIAKSTLNSREQDFYYG